MTTNRYIRFREALYSLIDRYYADCVLIENSPENYQRVLDEALPISRYALFVDLAEETSPCHTGFLCEALAIMPTDHWVGTFRWYPSASALWFSTNQALVELIRSVSNITDFCGPDHLEDLSLWTNELNWVMGCVAHESLLLVNRSTINLRNLDDIVIPQVYGPPRPGYTWPVLGDDGEWYDRDGNAIDIDIYMETEFKAWRGPKTA